MNKATTARARVPSRILLLAVIALGCDKRGAAAAAEQGAVTGPVAAQQTAEPEAPFPPLSLDMTKFCNHYATVGYPQMERELGVPMPKNLKPRVLEQRDECVSTYNHLARTAKERNKPEVVRLLNSQMACIMEAQSNSALHACMRTYDQAKFVAAFR